MVLCETCKNVEIEKNGGRNYYTKTAWLCEPSKDYHIWCNKATGKLIELLSVPPFVDIVCSKYEVL